MAWDEFERQDFAYENEDTERGGEEQDSYLNFDIFSALSKLKDFYKVLEVDYDATEEAIRSNYIRLALKWHPDKQKDQDSATLRFQEINEAYQELVFWGCPPCQEGAKASVMSCERRVLSDPVKRREYDKKGMLYVYDCNIIEYLNRYKGLILTCNGLGLKNSIW